MVQNRHLCSLVRNCNNHIFLLVDNKEVHSFKTVDQDTVNCRVLKYALLYTHTPLCFDLPRLVEVMTPNAVFIDLVYLRHADGNLAIR